MHVPIILRICGYKSAAEVRADARRYGQLVAPMKRDPEISELLDKWDAEDPIEY